MGGTLVFACSSSSFSSQPRGGCGPTNTLPKRMPGSTNLPSLTITLPGAAPQPRRPSMPVAMSDFVSRLTVSAPLTRGDQRLIGGIELREQIQRTIARAMLARLPPDASARRAHGSPALRASSGRCACLACSTFASSNASGPPDHFLLQRLRKLRRTTARTEPPTPW